MWISQQLLQNQGKTENQTGKSTLAGDGNASGIEVTASGTCRDVELYSPYGYCFSLPANQSVFLTRCDGKQAGIGVRLDSSSLENGEIKITSLSGAFIHLKNDGSVIINGLKINKNGVME